MISQADRVKRNLQFHYGVNEIAKALEGEELSKGKRAQVGEIREWQGKQWRKTANGWIPVGEKKVKKEKEDQSSFKLMSDGKAGGFFGSAEDSGMSPRAIEAEYKRVGSFLKKISKLPDEDIKEFLDGVQGARFHYALKEEKGQLIPAFKLFGSKNLKRELDKIRRQRERMSK